MKNFPSPDKLIFSFKCQNQLHCVLWTKQEIATTLAKHKNLWIVHIQDLVLSAKKWDTIRQQISVYSDLVADETMLDDYDKHLIDYFRQFGYTVNVDIIRPNKIPVLYTVFVEVLV